MLHSPAHAMLSYDWHRRSPLAAWLIDRMVARNFTVSAADRLGLIDLFRLPPMKIEVCYHGLELDRFRERTEPVQARRALGIPEAPTVGVIGRLAKEKGQRFLVEAAPRIIERCAAARFAFVGAGPDETQLRSRIAELGLTERFTFAGFQRDVRPWVDALDLVVMPSLYESAGLALLESLAMGKPAVASDLPCVSDQLGDQGCVRVPPGDEVALAEATAALLLDPERCRVLAAEGEAVVRRRFDIRKHVGQLMDAYDAVS
jgi:glycosyltransferase involved in cell wall biosynthesis